MGATSAAVRLNLGSGWHTIAGFDNLDPLFEDAWFFQDGLGEYDDASVEGITISHALMFLPLEKWPAAFADAVALLRAEKRRDRNAQDRAVRNA